MRASDADREHVAEVLQRAASEGRLLTEELEHRLEAAFAARTYGELDRLVADLPGPQLATRARTRDLSIARAALAIAAVPVMLVVIATVLAAVTGALALWWVWLLAGWWFLGHGRRRCFGAHSQRTLDVGGGWHRGRGGARGFWV
jgi:Domain of unknown function (DUF1707)